MATKIRNFEVGKVVVLWEVSSLARIESKGEEYICRDIYTDKVYKVSPDTYVIDGNDI